MFDHDGNLEIFEEFRIDRDLPKFQPTNLQKIRSITGENNDEMSSGQFESSIRSRQGGRIRFTSDVRLGRNTTLMVSGRRDPLVHLTWVQHLVLKLLDWVSPSRLRLIVRSSEDNDTPQAPPEITVHEFFAALKNSDEELKIVDGRARGYESALERARQTGQRALAEQLEAGIKAVRAETQLHALELTQTLSEATLIEFVKKSPKGLRLDWVRNFTRVIPEDVLETKLKCDERGIFDNYVILHYDPKAKSWAETQAEKEARKDPILFGVIEGRRVLYFVGDWIDEFCDLTLDQIADVLYKDMEEPPSTAAEELDPGNY